MTAFYRLYKNPKNWKNNLPENYHPRFVNQTTSRMDKVLELATAFSSFSSADIIGVLEVLKNVLAIELSNGHNVELEGFGTFTVSLKCPPFSDKKQIETEYVEFKTLKMRVSADLKNRVRRKMRLFKAQDISPARFRPDQRKKILIEYAREKGYITAKIYRQETNLCKASAAKELKKYIKEGLILKRGNGPTTFYVLQDDKE